MVFDSLFIFAFFHFSFLLFKGVFICAYCETDGEDSGLRAEDLKPHLRDFYVECDEHRIYFVYTGPNSVRFLNQEVRITYISILSSIFKVLMDLKLDFSTDIGVYKPIYAKMNFLIHGLKLTARALTRAPKGVVERAQENQYVFSVCVKDLIVSAAELDQTPDDFNLFIDDDIDKT